MADTRPADGIVLSKADYEVLIRVIDREKRTIQNARNRPYVEEPQFLSLNSFRALTPVGGIPALTFLSGSGSGTAHTGSGTDNVPGSAICDIYRLLDGQMKWAGFSRTVYNDSLSAVPGNIWCGLSQDNWGILWAVPGQGAGGGGSSSVQVEIDHNSIPIVYTDVTRFNIYNAVTYDAGNTGYYIIPIPSVDEHTIDLAVRIADAAEGGVLNNGATTQIILGDKQFTGVFDSSKTILITADGGGFLWSDTGNFWATVMAGGSYSVQWSDLSFGPGPSFSYDTDGSGNATFSLGGTGGIYFAVNGNLGGYYAVTLAKLTALGTDGSITVSGGIVTAYTAPT